MYKMVASCEVSELELTLETDTATEIESTTVLVQKNSAKVLLRIVTIAVLRSYSVGAVMGFGAACHFKSRPIATRSD